jgi:DNA-directed RNA polymerase subunit RPC12/RpoP
MPAPEQRVVNCPCGAKLLFRWTWAIGSVMYPVRCPDCGAEHQVHATQPIEVYHLGSKGNWEYVTTIGRAPT